MLVVEEGIVALAQQPVAGELEDAVFPPDGQLTEEDLVGILGRVAAVEGIVRREGQGDVGQGDDLVGPGRGQGVLVAKPAVKGGLDSAMT